MSDATPAPSQRSVILITSLVAGSQVGGGVDAALFALDGVRAQLVPTVLMGRHPGLGPPGGGATPLELFQGALDGLTANHRRARADAILAGYFRDPAQVHAAEAFISAARAENPAVLLLVDPILGDGAATGTDEGLFVPANVAAAIRDRLVPLADVITPNLFELSWLAGRPIAEEAEAVAAARALAPAALVTSAPAAADRVGVLAVSPDEAWALDTPRLEPVPNGAGDLFAAAALSARLEGARWPRAAALAAARTARALTATVAVDPSDLLLNAETLAAPDTLPRLRRVGAPRPAWAMGLDGCKSGWAAILVDMNGLEPPRRRIFDTFQAALDAGAQIIAVDMPIGFLDAPDGPGGRACEREARALLGARRSSVFPSPLRPALAAQSYAEAQALNRAAGGPGLSKQAYNLFPKLREIDAALTPALAGCVFETHPETSFAVISGAPAAHRKTTAEGRAERLALLAGQGLPRDLFEPHPFARKRCAPDDLVDAGLCALTALRIAAGDARVLPEDPPRDARGLVMAIHA